MQGSSRALLALYRKGAVPFPRLAQPPQETHIQWPGMASPGPGLQEQLPGGPSCGSSCAGCPWMWTEKQPGSCVIAGDVQCPCDERPQALSRPRGALKSSASCLPRASVSARLSSRDWPVLFQGPRCAKSQTNPRARTFPTHSSLVAWRSECEIVQLSFSFCQALPGSTLI